MVLWTVTAYLIAEHKPFWIALIPAVFMTDVAVSYILIAPEGLALSHGVSYGCGLLVSTGLLLYVFIYRYRRNKFIAFSRS